ncbi:MAG: hypothetical protein RSF83_08485 [Hungatella sp.]
MTEPMNYQGIIEDLRIRMRQTSENFVYIGWQLKQLIKTGMMQQAGYRSIEELGRAEFGLNKDDTYRFIRINSKYAVNGDSPELEERYRGMGQSKLSEMLSLPEEDMQLVTEKTTREDIRELNRFYKQNSEEVEPDQAAGGDLQAILMEFFRPGPGREQAECHKMLLKLLNIVTLQEVSAILTPEEQIQECINPKGNGVFRKGKYMLFLYDAVTGMKYKVFGCDKNHDLSYREFAKMAHLMFITANPEKDGMDAWESVYGFETLADPVVEERKKEPKETEKKEPQDPVKIGGEVKKAELKFKVDKQEEIEEIDESYPQENDQKAVLAPAQPEKPDPVDRMRKDVDDYLEKVKEALLENQYVLAKTEAKHLCEAISKIVEEMEQKEIAGQYNIQDYIQEEDE